MAKLSLGDGEEFEYTIEEKLSEEEANNFLLEKLGEKKIAYLDSLGEEGIKKHLDELIADAPYDNGEHKIWDEIGGILDYVNNQKYDWLIDYQIKTSEKCYGYLRGKEKKRREPDMKISKKELRDKYHNKIEIK